MRVWHLVFGNKEKGGKEDFRLRTFLSGEEAYRAYWEQVETLAQAEGHGEGIRTGRDVAIGRILPLLDLGRYLEAEGLVTQGGMRGAGLAVSVRPAEAYLALCRVQMGGEADFALRFAPTPEEALALALEMAKAWAVRLDLPPPTPQEASRAWPLLEPSPEPPLWEGRYLLPLHLEGAYGSQGEAGKRWVWAEAWRVLAWEQEGGVLPFGVPAVARQFR